MQAVQVLLENNVQEDRITFLNLIASPEGMNAFVKRYPKIKIVCAEIDDTLDKNKYIVPGVGDFGCRWETRKKELNQIRVVNDLTQICMNYLDILERIE